MGDDHIQSKIKLKVTKKGKYRSIVASENIMKGETILKVPLSKMITKDVVKNSDLGQEILKYFDEGDQILFILYFMQELKKPEVD